MKTRFICIIILVISLHACIFPQINSKPEVKCNYLLYKPLDYSTTTGPVPLIIYLHGKSQRGNDLKKLKGYGLPYLIDKGHNYKCIVASPQCPDTVYWSGINWFSPLYNELSSKLRIDSNRVYVIGISLGGYGSWQAAMDFPAKIAAIVPLCGGCTDSLEICRISQIPIWTFHGTADNIVPISETESLVDRLNSCNGNVKFTRVQDAGHDITKIFENSEIYDWLLQQKKNEISK